jgi:hypothetical protein
MHAAMTKRLLLAAATTLAASCVVSSGPRATVPPPVIPPDKAPDTTPPTPPVPDEPQAVGTPSTSLIPRDLLFGNPVRAGVQISPDGKSLSWRAEVDGVMNVWVAPVGDLAAAKAVTDDKVRPIRQYFWSEASTHIIYMQDVGGDENFHAFAVELATGKRTDLTPYPGVRAEVVGTSTSAPGTLLIAMNDRDASYHDVYKVELATGARTLVLENKDKFAGFVADDALRVRIAVKARDDGGMTYLGQGDKGWVTAFEELRQARDGLGRCPGAGRVRGGVQVVPHAGSGGRRQGPRRRRPRGPRRWCSSCTAGPVGARPVGCYNPTHQWLASRGYAVLSVNYRGSTGFGKKFINAADKEWAGKMHDDLIDAVRWAVSAGVATRRGRASTAAATAATRRSWGSRSRPTQFACGVDIVGPSNLVTLLENASRPTGRPSCPCSPRSSATTRPPRASGALRALSRVAREPDRAAAAHRPGRQRSARQAGSRATRS